MSHRRTQGADRQHHSGLLPATGVYRRSVRFGYIGRLPQQTNTSLRLLRPAVSVPQSHGKLQKMAEESKSDAAGPGESVPSKDADVKRAKKKKGVLSRIWVALFRLRGDDFEKRLEHISKEEAAVLARITKRSHSWRRIARNLIVLSLMFEVVAVGYALMSTRSLDLNWKTRALRVFPMFLLPVLSFTSYSLVRSFTRMRLNRYPSPVRGNDVDQSSHSLTVATRDLFNDLDRSVMPVAPMRFLNALRSKYPQYA